ncbi:MAG: molecular chaperone TorD family protein [Nitrospinae bacterium]|nr:molecular chaperone TorD family protein [Nitrospinota bacterium]
MNVDSDVSEIFHTLSEIFKPPEESFAGQLFSSRVKIALDGWARKAGFDLDCPAVPEGAAVDESSFFSAMSREYFSIFEGPMSPFTPLIESVHKPWDKSGQSSLGPQTGYFFGDPAIDMMSRFTQARMEIPGDYSHAPDHLCLLLEYYAMMGGDFSAGARQEFLAGHFDWLGQVWEEVTSNPSALIYPPMLKYAMGIIAAETARVSGLAGGL